MRFLITIAAIFLSAAPTPGGQRYVDPSNTYHRVYAIVPVNQSSPRRPLYVPTPDQIGAKSGIVGFSSRFSDDGNYALIELVARDRSVLVPILNDKSVKSFEKGVANPSDIESAFRAYSPSFSFSTFDEVQGR
jgi:hypothetical protein